MPQTSLYKDHFRLHRLVGNTVIIGLLASLAAFMFFLHKLDIQLFLQSSAMTHGTLVCAATALVCFILLVLLTLGYIVYIGRVIGKHEQKKTQLIESLSQQHEKFRLIDERYKMIIDNSDIAIFEYDCKTKLYTSFENCEKLLQKSREQINADLAHTRYLDAIESDKALFEYFYHPEDVPHVTKFSKSCINTGRTAFDARLLKADGSSLWCHVYIAIIESREKQPYKILGLFMDIDKNKREAELFRFQADREPLTQFYNKAATAALISKRLNEDNGIRHSLLLLDIDHFKNVNDTMGHLAGDALISEIAKRLQLIFRSNDILGRVGGDEFVIFVSGLSNRTHLQKKVQEISEAFAGLTFSDYSGQKITVSIGVTTTTAVATTYEILFTQADKALYEAKETGRNTAVFYNDNMEFSKSYLSDTVVPTKQFC